MTLVVEACFDCNGTEYLSSLCNRFRDEHKICNSRSQDVNFSCCCLRNASSSMIVYSTSKIKKIGQTLLNLSPMDEILKKLFENFCVLSIYLYVYHIDATSSSNKNSINIQKIIFYSSTCSVFSIK